jgi:hypothetical protein
MTDNEDDPTSDTTHPHQELVAAINAALAPQPDATVRSAGAIACRTALGIIEPSAPRPAPAPAPPVPPTTSPLDTKLSALAGLPKEQLLPVIGLALRSVFGHKPPAYRSRPAPPREPARPAVSPQPPKQARSQRRGSGGSNGNR